MEHGESSFSTGVICQGEGKEGDILLSEVISVGETAECQFYWDRFLELVTENTAQS